MKKYNLHEVSDALSKIKTQLNDGGHGGVYVSSEEVIQLAAELDHLTRCARRLENEVSRHRWNDAARHEQAEAKKIVEAALVEDSNVVLLPSREQPFN